VQALPLVPDMLCKQASLTPVACAVSRVSKRATLPNTGVNRREGALEPQAGVSRKVGGTVRLTPGQPYSL
jgi:hypothetical protein